MVRRRLSIGLALSLSGAAPGASDVCKWSDAEGRVHFGDRPPAQSDAQPVTLRINTYSQPEIVREAATVLLAPRSKVVVRIQG